MVASTKLSFNQASSPAMKTFVQTVIHESRQFPTKPPKELFDVPNRKTIAKKMIQESDSLLAEFFHHLPTRVCLSVDGGTLGHTGYNIYCATNPIEMVQPLLWTIRAEGKSAEIYSASIGSIVRDLSEKGITVTSCVTDGFLGLVSGMRMATMHGLKQIAFHWPCMAPRLNNALSKTVAMHTISVSTFEQVRTVCRSSHTNLRNHFNHRAPQFVETRWASLTPLLHWIVKKKDLFNQLPPFQRDGLSFADVVQMYNLVIPIFRAISFFESDSTSLVSVFPVLVQLFEHYHKLSLSVQVSTTVWKPVILSMMENLYSYTFNTEAGTIAALAYIHTLEGRKAFVNNTFCIYERMEPEAKSTPRRMTTIVPRDVNTGDYVAESTQTLNVSSRLSHESHVIPTPPALVTQISTHRHHRKSHETFDQLLDSIVDDELSDIDDGEMTSEPIATPYLDPPPQSSLLIGALNQSRRDEIQAGIEAVGNDDEISVLSSARGDIALPLFRTFDHEDKWHLLNEIDWKTILPIAMCNLLEAVYPQLDATSINSIVRVFNYWSSSTNSFGGDVLRHDGLYPFWRSMVDEETQIGLSSNLVCSLFCTSPTEASCEREISALRRFVGNRRFNLSETTLLALTRVSISQQIVQDEKGEDYNEEQLQKVPVRQWLGSGV